MAEGEVRPRTRDEEVRRLRGAGALVVVLGLPLAYVAGVHAAYSGVLSTSGRDRAWLVNETSQRALVLLLHQLPATAVLLVLFRKRALHLRGWVVAVAVIAAAQLGRLSIERAADLGLSRDVDRGLFPAALTTALVLACLALARPPRTAAGGD